MSLVEFLAAGNIDAASKSVRLKRFLQSALGFSTVALVHNTILTTEIAFALEYLQIETGDIKKSALRDIPILSLLWVNDALAPEETLNVLQYQQTKQMTDDEARVYLGGFLDLSQVMYTALLVDGTTAHEKNCRALLWDRLMVEIMKPSTTIIFPKVVSWDIQKAVIENRCKRTKLGFLSQTRKPILAGLFDDENVVNNQPLNAPTESVCTAVADLYMLSHTKTTSMINGCFKLLEKFSPADLGMTAGSDAYNKLKGDVDAFRSSVQRWDDINLYVDTTDEFCTAPTECESRLQRLHTIAQEVDKYATQCKQSLRTYRKQNLRRRRKDGDSTLTYSEKLLSWF
jgi:hypothetical protein